MRKPYSNKIRYVLALSLTLAPFSIFAADEIAAEETAHEDRRTFDVNAFTLNPDQIIGTNAALATIDPAKLEDPDFITTLKKVFGHKKFKKMTGPQIGRAVISITSINSAMLENSEFIDSMMDIFTGDGYIQELIEAGCTQNSAEAIALFADSQDAFLKPLKKDENGNFIDLVEFTGKLRAAGVPLVPSSATAEDATKLISLMQIVMLTLEDRSNIANYASELVASNTLPGKKYARARDFFPNTESAQTAFISSIANGIEKNYNQINAASTKCLVDLSGFSLEEKALFESMMSGLSSGNLDTNQKEALCNIKTWETMILQFVFLRNEKTEV